MLLGNSKANPEEKKLITTSSFADQKKVDTETETETEGSTTELAQSQLMTSSSMMIMDHNPG